MDVSQTYLATTLSGERQTADSALQRVAVELEATFLAEMLKSAGLGKARSAFGGGAGEEQFNSFLVRQQADQLARSGGIGLAESLFNALKDSRDGQY
ncbi:rod-binding protein [Ruegeria sp. 1NDH52C]|uniref:Rod-binding protein n=1 Tax=Ruegeria alba TaxID=2916756 RepID=A0ABS9NVM9_9RHOB|nr:rod-binding protein [Ruegeria alba]MCG6558081.1 rod-binding protein [Ruegeria alba]